MSRGTRKSYYLPTKEAEFIRELAEINFRPESYFIKIAIDILAEQLGGFGDDNGTDPEKI